MATLPVLKHHLHTRKQKVCHLLLPLVAIQCVFHPLAPGGCLYPCCTSHCFSLAKPIKIQDSEGSSGFLPKLQHCSSLNNNSSVLSASCLPASVGPLLIPGVWLQCRLGPGTNNKLGDCSPLTERKEKRYKGQRGDRRNREYSGEASGEGGRE